MYAESNRRSPHRWLQIFLFGLEPLPPALRGLERATELGFELDLIPDPRESCNACIMACYRNGSMLMHVAVAATDAARVLAAGQMGSAIASHFRRSDAAITLSINRGDAADAPR